MKTRGRFIRFIGAAWPWVLLILALYLLGRGAGAVWVALLGLDKEVTVSIIASVGTVLAAVAAVMYNQRRAQARSIREQHRAPKVALYKSFMDNALVGVLRLMREKGGDAVAPEDLPDDLEEFFLSFHAELIVWGAPGVISAYDTFRRRAGGKDTLLLLDDVLQAIRKDLGHSNWALSRGDLISLFLKDPEELKKLMA